MKFALQIIIIVIMFTSCKEEKKNAEQTIGTRTKIDTIQKETLDVKRIIPNYSTIDKPIITEKDYSNFFNQVLNENGLIINENIEISLKESSYWKSELINLTEKKRDSSLSKILDLNDVEFMLEQESIQKNFYLKPSQINRKKISKKKLDNIELKNPDLDNYWNEIYKYGNGYYDLSLPVFSIDKTIAIFDYSYSCGSLCAESTTRVYKEENGKWEYIGWIGTMTVS